jgi:glucosylceramidase
MSRVRPSVTSVCLALLVAACGSSTITPNPGNGGSSGDQGGSSGSGGSSETQTGGSQAGGSSGNPAGGSQGNPTGGSQGNPKGGAAGSGNGGAGGSASTPGNGGGSGNPSGGAGPGNGGASSNNGGDPGAGGSQGTGGAPAPSTALVTSAQNAFWKTATWTEASSGNADVTVNDGSAQQDWQGMGGAFNELGWSYLTTKDLQDQALQLLFGSDGCRFAWGRIPMGASDYGTSRYTLDDTGSDVAPDGSESNRPPADTSLSKFSIDRDTQKLIPYIKAAQAVKSDIRFWASPWTPPPWMKTGYLKGNKPSYYDGGTMKSDDATLKAHAQYFVKFVQAYADKGIKVEIVAPQNEPNYQQNYPSCHWDTANFVKFVGSYLGPALAAANLTTKVMDGTLSNTSGDSDIGQQVLKDATAKGFVGAIGVQWGMAASNQVSTLKNLAGGIPIWLSEHQCGGNMNTTSPAPNDYAYGQASWGYIRDAVKNGLTAYNAWNMVLDKVGMGIDTTRNWPQNALLVVDSGKITATPAYYVFRHVSQFVEPGAKVVATSGSSDAIAFKNPDGSLVAVVYSGSAKSNYTVAIGGKKLQFSMPSGWATVKYKP